MKLIYFIGVVVMLVNFGEYCRGKNLGKILHNSRKKRWINGELTKTILATATVTSWIPSSCVYVEQSLPPCRNIRFLHFPTFYANPPIYGINGEVINYNGEKRSYDRLEAVETTLLSWGEFFGLYAPTVTVTNTLLATTVVRDPRIVVTYAVKGCQPSKLPMDLERCPSDEELFQTVHDIVPTSTVHSNFVPATSAVGFNLHPNHNYGSGLDSQSLADLINDPSENYDIEAKYDSTPMLPVEKKSFTFK